MFPAAGVSLLLGTGLAIGITRSVTRTINEAVKVAEAVAAGDLTSEINLQRQEGSSQAGCGSGRLFE